MSKFGKLDRIVGTILSNGSPRVQADTLNHLLTEVQKFTRLAAEVKDLASEKRALENEIASLENKKGALEAKVRKEADEAVEEQIEALGVELRTLEEDLAKAEQAEDMWKDQRTVLKSIQGPVETLRKELDRIV